MAARPMPISKPSTNFWMASVYAGVITAVFAILTALMFQAENPVLYIPAFLLIGVGPVLGYQFATGKPGSDWKSIIAGFVSFVLLILGFILWPILVGALTKGQSIGKLFLASLIGIILGAVVLLIAASTMGSNPSWIATGFVLLWAVWGGACGAAMVAWGE